MHSRAALVVAVMAQWWKLFLKCSVNFKCILQSLVCIKYCDSNEAGHNLPSLSLTAPPRIILGPPSTDGIYTVEEGADFVLTCEVDRYSYPRITQRLLVFRVNGSDLIPIDIPTNPGLKIHAIIIIRTWYDVIADTNDYISTPKCGCFVVTIIACLQVEMVF